jgi:delta8-fatty-acid desaturase
LLIRLHSPEAREWMKSYAIGWIEGSWNNLVPPIQNERNKVESPSSKPSGSSNSPDYNEEDINRKEIEQDLAKYPSLDYKTQRNITQKYRELEKRIRAEGLYNCNYRAYGRECIRYFCLFWGCMLFLRLGWYKTSALLLGLFWHQLAFTAHDAGHMGITHNFQVDTCIGIFTASFCGGLSIGWWKRSHNVS